MNDLQKKFVELDRKKDEVKQFFDEYGEVIAELAKQEGIGAMFQDEQGVVYQIEIPEGRFVHYEKFGVKRTRREGERAGSLSLTKAREAGFVVEGK